MKKTMTAAVVSLVLAGNAFAGVIYDEGASGDLDALPTSLGNLALGSNEIIGYLPATPPPDSDRFTVTLAAGLQIDSITVSYDTLSKQYGENINVGMGTNGNLFDDAFIGYVDAWTAGYESGFSAALVDTFGPDTGPLDTTLAGSVWDFQISAGLIYPGKNWTVTIVTSPFGTPPPGDKVPAPAALGLLGLGLAGLGLARRRHRSQ